MRGTSARKKRSAKPARSNRERRNRGSRLPLVIQERHSVRSRRAGRRRGSILRHGFWKAGGQGAAWLGHGRGLVAATPSVVGRGLVAPTLGGMDGGGLVRDCRPARARGVVVRCLTLSTGGRCFQQCIVLGVRASRIRGSFL
jgi:hypothetical protein